MCFPRATIQQTVVRGALANTKPVDGRFLSMRFDGHAEIAKPQSCSTARILAENTSSARRRHDGRRVFWAVLHRTLFHHTELDLRLTKRRLTRGKNTCAQTHARALVCSGGHLPQSAARSHCVVEKSTRLQGK